MSSRQRNSPRRSRRKSSEGGNQVLLALFATETSAASANSAVDPIPDPLRKGQGIPGRSRSIGDSTPTVTRYGDVSVTRSVNEGFFRVGLCWYPSLTLRVSGLRFGFPAHASGFRCFRCFRCFQIGVRSSRQRLESLRRAVKGYPRPEQFRENIAPTGERLP